MPGPGQATADSDGALDPILGQLVAELRSRGVSVRPGTRLDREPDLALTVGERRIAVLWDGHPEHGYRPALAGALSLFGWQVCRVRTAEIATGPARAADLLLR